MLFGITPIRINTFLLNVVTNQIMKLKLNSGERRIRKCAIYNPWVSIICSRVEIHQVVLECTDYQILLVDMDLGNLS